MKKFIVILLAALLVACQESPKFKLLDPEKTGIDFNNIITETDSFHVMSYEYIYNGAGVGIGDLNNDGLQDIIFAGNQVTPRVYLNEGGFRFRDITANFAGLTNEQWYSSVTLVDINNDRWLDVYLTSTANKDPGKCRNRLWVSSGSSAGKDPAYNEMAEVYGINEEGQSVNATFFDYDLDGDLDLYVLNNTVNERMNTSYRPKITDGSAMNNDRLYRNDGNGRFSDVTIQAGIVCEGFGLGLAIGDVNKDGFPDIYVSNDYISNDLLYINQRDGTFRNEIRKYMSYQTKSSMGNDMADVNNDGNPDMFTLDMMPESYVKKKQTINGFSYIFYVNDAKYDYEHQYLRNMLHVNNGFLNGEMIPFSEVGQMAGIYQTEWSWAPLFADYDNDGDKDLIVTNGFPMDMTDKDWTKYKADVFGFVASVQQVIEMAPSVKVPNIAFENKGDLLFERKGKEWLPDLPSYSYGAAFADLDNDGDLDYVTNNLNDKAFVYRNYSVEKSKKPANFIRIKLLGKDGNTMAIGAKIELWSKGNYQFTEHFMTRGYASSVDPVTHFGVGDALVIDSLKVTWPLGLNVTVLKNQEVNKTIEIDEASSASVNNISEPVPVSKYMFEKTDGVINYTHEQTDFIDFFLNQNIIPHKFSQIGPRIAQGDLNKDGLNDLIIGSTNVNPTTVFLNRGGWYEQANIEGLTTKKEFTESDLAIADIDGDGDNDVLAVAGGYENKNENEFVHYLYENRDGAFVRSALPVSPFSASVVRPFDFDHDGDIDIFIGSRIRKGMYPYATSSWLIINDKGKLTADDNSKLNLGMVTDAIWTDYDKDGWEDLLVAREWNSIALYKNMQGKNLSAQIIPELEKHQGVWYSLVAGDFDQDGDDDYAAGNLGNNHRFHVSEKYPMSLYAIDVDNDGNIDPIITAWWNDQESVMKEYPINYFDELCAQTRFFQSKFNSYKAFSEASLAEIFDKDILARVEFTLNVNTTSSYIIWNDAGKMRFEEMTIPLQVSPITRMISTDLNGDKFPDLLLAGNDYSYDVATGNFDANKGMVLINNGDKSTFTVLPPSKSGLLINGMVQSLLFIKGDTSLVVAGINRSKVEVFKLNKPILP